MIVTRILTKYFAGKLDELTNEQIKRCEWNIKIHEPPRIQISGEVIEIITGLDIDINKNIS